MSFRYMGRVLAFVIIRPHSQNDRAVHAVRHDHVMETAGTGRLEAFSDGVFAIAATLLVLSFSVGTVAGSELDTALFHLWPSYLAYATSFLTIGIIWMNHHHLVELIGRADRTLQFINLVLLMIVGFLPFPTKLVADYLRTDGEQAATLAYAATFVVMAVTYNVWWRYASTGRRLIAEGVHGPLTALSSRRPRVGRPCPAGHPDASPRTPRAPP